MDPFVDPAELVVNLRRAKGMTQAQLAEILEVSRSQISEWETGSASPSAEAWVRMGNIAPWGQEIAYYKCAGMEERILGVYSRGTERILEFIKKVDPAMAGRIRQEIEGMNPSERLDRVTQALLEIAQPQTPAGDKAYLDQLKAATEDLHKATEALRSTLKK